MIFTTYWFVVAVTSFLLFFMLVPQATVRKYAMLVFCIIFHSHFAGPAGVAPIVVVGFLVYFAGLSQKKYFIDIAIAVSVAALIWYKYAQFLSLQVFGLISPTWGQQMSEWAREASPLTPPLAISFFTFEFVHYLYDVKKGHKPIRNLTDFWLFTLFFPSLVAGPIKRFENFIPSLHRGLASRLSSTNIALGLQQIAIGFVKKVLIADNLTSYLHHTHPQYASLEIGERWLFVILVGMRILMDFSGYSDIAIGLARLMNIEIPRNFNWPYLASNIREFWQRWHISLSSWIRDYVYIPLGGGRRGVARTAFNGIFAFAICGLWHGPTWNFIFWGLYHGFGLAFSSNYQRLLGPVGRSLGNVLTFVPGLSWMLTLFFVFVGWLFFFYSMSEATQMVALLFVRTL